MNSKRIDFLNLAVTSGHCLSGLEEAALKVIRSGRYLHGEETARLESRLAAMCGVENAICVSNGLDALRLIFRGLLENGRLHQGQEVLVPATTYIASILPILEFGLIPVFIEPDERTFSINFSDALRHVTDRTGALLTTHLYGIPAWDRSAALQLHRRGILIIEDNAQAIGAEASEEGLNGSNVCGGLADAAAFSFYPTKNIGALGDAGAVTTPDKELGATIRALANYGSDRRYHNIYRGYNCRMDEIQAAFLNVKLDHLEEDTQRRREAAAVYFAEIRHPEFRLPSPPEGCHPVWHQFVVRCRRRDEMAHRLDLARVGTDIHYAVPPHLQPCLKDLSHSPLPLTEAIASEVLSLPIANIDTATAAEVARRINAL